MQLSGTVNYIDRNAPEPTTYYVPPPEGVPICSVVDDPREVAIADARDTAHPFSMEEHGISFVKLPTDFRDFDDTEAVRARLYPEMEALTRSLLGQEVVAATDHATRRRPVTQSSFRGTGVERQPLHRVHCDLTPATARQGLLRTFGERGEELVSRRFAVVNYWRPITGPLRDDPLAVCDPRSVEADDLVRIRHVYDSGESEIFGVAYNPRHRWHFMSDMQPDDAIFFKVYDSGEERPLVAPHTAFSLKQPKQPVLPRESFELRLIVVYD